MPHLLTRILSPTPLVLPAMSMCKLRPQSLTLSMSMSKSTLHTHAHPVNLHVDRC